MESTSKKENGPQAFACGPPGGLFGLTKRWSLYVPRRGYLPRLGTALKRGHFNELRVRIIEASGATYAGGSIQLTG
jgi:hypothetical protein